MTGQTDGKPSLSVVVVVFDMPREAPRTLYSLSAAYQRHIGPDDYEVIVVDNGSEPPFDAAVLDGLSGHFRLIRIDDASPSPAQAVNRGLAEARGDVIGVMVDGARIATPRLLHLSRHAAGLYDRAVVATLGWFVGYDLPRWAMEAGFDREREDALLASIGWPEDGYRLFDVGTMDGSSVDGWLAPINESNALFMRRELWDVVGGMDERFDEPGGGFVNLDLFHRAAESPGAELVILLGEATFHQMHGGASTSASVERFEGLLSRWSRQYEAIRGGEAERPKLTRSPTYLGTLPRPALARFVRAAVDPVQRGGSTVAPLGPGFEQGLWSPSVTPRPADPTIAALVELAQNEFRARRHAAAAAVARLARRRAPDEPEPQRLLALLASWLPFDRPDPAHGAEYHLALAEAHRLLGENEAAALDYRASLTFDPDRVQAHIGLATLRMPGVGYLTWLERIYEWLAPETAIEVGVYQGASLALLRPPTLAIGIDPAPTVRSTLKTETHIFTETSEDFFARGGPDALLAGRPLSVAFIDGLHLFEQALKDFIDLERYCGPRSVIMFHDTVPLNEATQTRSRDTQFHTGDVWKTVLCLKHLRPDLDIFTIATPWTGLTVVTGLDASSRVLADGYEEAIARFIDVPYGAIADSHEEALNMVPNDWDVVRARLERRLSSPPRLRTGEGASSRAKQRGLYLDLLIQTLTNMIYGDPSNNPTNVGPFQAEVRAVGGDWPTTAHTMVGLLRLENLRGLVQRAIDEDIPGDLIETGVWRGGACILMRGVLAANGVEDRKVYAADSFDGLPPPSPDRFRLDEGSNLHLFRELAVSVDQVKANFDRYGLLDDQVVFVEGLFQDTLPTLEADRFAVIRLDGDMYGSTYVALEALYPKLSPGGFVVIDDFGALASCRAAVMDYRTEMAIDAPIQEIDWTGVWWQKPHASADGTRDG